MKTPTSIPDDRITSNVPVGVDGTKPSDVNPGGKTFKVPVPKTPTDPKPSITIEISPNMPVLVEKINLPPTTTNVEKVTIMVPKEEVEPSREGTTTTTPSSSTTPTSAEEYVTIVDKETVTDTGDVFLPNSPKVTKVKVIIESPKKTPDGNTPTEYFIEIKTHACINGKLPYTFTAYIQVNGKF